MQASQYTLQYSNQPPSTYKYNSPITNVHSMMASNFTLTVNSSYWVSWTYAFRSQVTAQNKHYPITYTFIPKPKLTLPNEARDNDSALKCNKHAQIRDLETELQSQIPELI